jgi:Bacterial PH domain
MGLFGRRDQGPQRADVAAAEARMGAKVGVGKAIKAIDAQLLPDEQLLEMSVAWPNGERTRLGVLAVTTKRIWFVADKMGDKSSIVVPIKNVTSVTAKSTPLKILSGNSIEISHSGGIEVYEVGNKNVERLRVAAVSAQLS